MDGPAIGNCGCGIGAPRSVDILMLENPSDGVDTGAVDTLWVENASVGIETGALGVDNPEVNLKVVNGTFDVFPLLCYTLADIHHHHLHY